MTPSPEAAVGTFLFLIRLLHRWVIQICLCRFNIWASGYPITPASMRSHYIGLAVDKLRTGRERQIHYAMLQSALLARGEGRQRELISSLTPTNTPGASHRSLADENEQNTIHRTPGIMLLVEKSRREKEERYHYSCYMERENSCPGL